ncbi:aminodeoxychorismate lyase [Fontimonas sp. SYSU GA230001]|uniref:aminodeoxychorismate lyase n=1 Tax=Fontimonas sp. SYSU GA230001 TaxID=3142450 RepID=UPI0032B4736E
MIRVLHDGVPCADELAHSRALHYGDGVFRTMLWSGGGIVDWALHMDKLAADCAALRLDCPSPSRLAAETGRVVSGAADHAVKLIVARRPGERGYRPTTSASEHWLYAYPLAPAAVTPYRSGARLAFSDVVLSEQALLAGVKHLNRLDQVLASRNWPDGIDELLMCDRDGHVISGTRSNLFCITGQRLLTPALDRCGVAGIMRRRIIDCASELGLHVMVAPLTADALRQSDEAFVCNALIGVWPVQSLAGRIWAAPGAATHRLMQFLRHPRTPL